jgi:hypothetical protein
MFDLQQRSYLRRLVKFSRKSVATAKVRLMEVENLRRATLAGLREKYKEVFQEETRSRHREHLFRRIAWRLQVLAEGDLSERARGRARESRAMPICAPSRHQTSLV